MPDDDLSSSSSSESSESSHGPDNLAEAVAVGQSAPLLPDENPSSSTAPNPPAPAEAAGASSSSSSSGSPDAGSFGPPWTTGAGGSSASSASSSSESCDYEADYAIWRAYKTGGTDNAGNRIERVYAKDRTYILYFSNNDLYYETTEELLRGMAPFDLRLAAINRLLPSDAALSPADLCRKKQTLELAADAYEMWFCGHQAEAKQILDDIVATLSGNLEGEGRLLYQAGTVYATVFLWVVIYVFKTFPSLGILVPHGCFPWIHAAALGALGGTLSVCMNLGKITVNVNQNTYLLTFAGITRAGIALLGGVALLLAMRAKVILGIASGGTPNPSDALLLTEMFFCFLAGFSETFVPNILGDAEKNVTSKGKVDSQTPSSGGAQGAGAPNTPSGSSSSESSTSSESSGTP